MVKILIVDDAKFMRMTLTNLFEKNGLEVVGSAENGLEGVRLFKELSPHIVMLDMTMPVMDGLQALKEILLIDPEANVIMCSAMGQQRLVVEAIENGAKDFIVKPFDEQRVLETIKRIVS